MREAGVAFTVFGTPAPAGSKKGFPVRGKGGRIHVRMTDDSKRSKPWQASIRAEAAAAMDGREAILGAVAATFTFYVRRPKGHYSQSKTRAGQLLPSAPRYPTVKPDGLKLARAVEDALTGIVYSDDAVIVEHRISKRYGTPERVEIRIEELEAVTTAEEEAA